MQTYKAHYEGLSSDVRAENVNPYLKVVQGRYRKYLKKLATATEKQEKLKAQGKAEDTDTLALQRDLEMQLEEIHYLTVEFQKWDETRVAEESKKEEVRPATPPPQVDEDQI